MEELRMAEALNEQELLPSIRNSIKRYSGKHTPAIAYDWTLIVNEIYPVVQFNLPSIFFRNPQVFLKPKHPTFIAKRRDPISGRMESVLLDAGKSAKTQEAILNYQLIEIRYKDEVRKVLLDSLLFPHGVLWHGYKGDFGMTDEDSLYIDSEEVFVERLSPMRFLKDPCVTYENLHKGRWVARKLELRLSELLDDQELSISKKLKDAGRTGFSELIGKGNNGNDKVTPRPLIDYASDSFKKSKESKFISAYEVFLRPTKKESRKGIPGHCLLLTFDQDEPLRESPWPYDAEGFPGRILQFNPVPDQQLGIADIETYCEIADHKNLTRNQQIRNMEETNRVIIGISKEGADEESVTKVVNGENSVVLYEEGNPGQRMYVASPNVNASSEAFLVDQRLDKEIQDKSGVSDLKKGFIQSGEESAASVRIRSAGGNARPMYRQDIMADFLRDSVAYINQLIKQFFPVEKVVRIVGSTDIEWSDEFTKEEIQAEVDVDLDVISMVPPNPDREIQEITQVINLMVEALANPAIFQKIQQEGKTFNLSPLIENLLQRLRIRNPEVFRQIRLEESMGYVSAAELQAAKANVDAAISGQEPPSPPAEGQDHRARLDIYTSINGLLNALGQQSQLLEQLIMLQAQLAEAEAEQKAPKVPSKVRTGATGRATPAGVGQ